ncbi:MAG TPA: cytochrome c oxidase subunit I [Acidimicrobiales bacterium]|nr:cytochrome c oxidase subunit I [Acidimicrobiales bacterium]
MTTVEERPVAAEEPPEPEHAEARGLLAFLTSTDHKRIGISYMATAFAFYLIAGALAMVIRTELAEPGTQVVSQGRYNEMFTMHGSIMLFLFLGPFAFGLANYLVPLQVGARDMAFPRLNALSYWFYLFGGITMLTGFLTADGAADFGWTGYTPLSSIVRSAGLGGDVWLMGIVLTGLSGVLTGVNIVATVVSMRAPGMRMFRMPIFTWNMLVTSVLVLMVFPIITAAGVMLFADRQFGAHIYDPVVRGGIEGSPVLWQHLFWFFGHPEVYILVLPYFGIITEILPVFSRRPVFGYASLVFATMAIAALSMGVWAHHMFTTGAVLLPFFTGFSMLIAVPTGVKFFNWIGTMWGGSIVFPTPMLFALGFLFTFLMGGVTGVMLAAAPIDFHVHDSYFVVAHMHYVLFGGSVFALFAGVYYWSPKVTGRVLDERLGKVHFWMTLVGFHLTFLVQHVLGLEGMPRRVADYLDDDGFTGLNQVSTVGAFLLGASTLPFLWNALQTWRGRLGRVAGDDPWEGHTLEWATTSPPAPENFTAPLPPIRSQRPVWDLHHGAPVTPGVPGGDGRSEGDRATGDGGPSGESASGGAPEEAP